MRLSYVTARNGVICVQGLKTGTRSEGNIGLNENASANSIQKPEN